MSHCDPPTSFSVVHATRRDARVCPLRESRKNTARLCAPSLSPKRDVIEQNSDVMGDENKKKKNKFLESIHVRFCVFAESARFVSGFGSFPDTLHQQYQEKTQNQSVVWGGGRKCHRVWARSSSHLIQRNFWLLRFLQMLSKCPDALQPKL